MARITICDLCKEKIKDDGELCKLAITFYTDQMGMNAEICAECYGALRNALNSDVRIFPSKSPTPQTVKMPTLADVQPPANFNAFPQPNEGGELLDGESVKIPSSVDLRKGSTDIAKLNRNISKAQKCPHYFKSYEEGKVVCTDAPEGVEGPFASFVGCEKVLNKDEI